MSKVIHIFLSLELPQPDNFNERLYYPIKVKSHRFLSENRPVRVTVSAINRTAMHSLWVYSYGLREVTPIPRGPRIVNSIISRVQIAQEIIISYA